MKLSSPVVRVLFGVVAAALLTGCAAMKTDAELNAEKQNKIIAEQEKKRRHEIEIRRNEFEGKLQNVCSEGTSVLVEYRTYDQNIFVTRQGSTLYEGYMGCTVFDRKTYAKFTLYATPVTKEEMNQGALGRQPFNVWGGTLDEAKKNLDEARKRYVSWVETNPKPEERFPSYSDINCISLPSAQP